MSHHLSMRKAAHNTLQQGFTLIELLIVIVIIGILAGVLISVINPSQQSNRAKDAGVQASLNKVALGTEGFVSAYGRSPTGAEFIGGLQNVTAAPISGAGCGATDEFCMYSVTGNDLPNGSATTGGCGSNGYSGTGTGQCYFRYERLGGATGVSFNLYGKSFGIADSVFKYTNTLGAISTCAAGSVNQGNPGC